MVINMKKFNRLCVQELDFALARYMKKHLVYWAQHGSAYQSCEAKADRLGMSVFCPHRLSNKPAYRSFFCVMPTEWVQALEDFQSEIDRRELAELV